MKQQILLLAATLVLLPTTVNGQSPAARWLRYTVKGEEFSVVLPAEPTLKTSQVFQPRLQKNRSERVLEARIDDQVFTVYVYENSKPRQSLEDFIDEQNKDSRLNPSTARTVTIGKVRGKEYLSQDAKNTEQFFVTDKRLYRFVTRGISAEQDVVQQFFSSIMLGKDQDGIEVEEGVPIQPSALEKIYTIKEVDQKARALSRPHPSYTQAARNRGTTGVVRLTVVFSSTGKVTQIRVVYGLPHGLTEKAVEAARKIKFVPAMKDGKPVSVWMQLEYNFNLY